MKKAICWHLGFMRMIIQRRESSIDFLHPSLMQRAEMSPSRLHP